MADERELELYRIKVFYSNTCHDSSQDEIKENIESMKKIIRLNPILSEEERNYLSIVYKAGISPLRDTLSHLKTMIQKPNLSSYPSRLEGLRNFEAQLQKEIVDLCNDFIDLVENYLLNDSSPVNDRVFYNKLLGDYSRYMCEAVNVEQNQERGRNFYHQALEIAKNELPPASPLVLGVILNYSVFLYEIMNRSGEAIELASTTFQETVDQLDSLSDKTREESIMILRLLKDNYNRWKSLSEIPG